METSSGLTHFNEQGRARMVDVSDIAETKRSATALTSLSMKAETLELI
jgi:cyclic pyranopterin monophosphate synthase